MLSVRSCSSYLLMEFFLISVLQGTVLSSSPGSRIFTMVSYLGLVARFSACEGD